MEIPVTLPPPSPQFSSFISFLPQYPTLPPSRGKAIADIFPLSEKPDAGNADLQQPFLWLPVGWSQLLTAWGIPLCNSHGFCSSAQLCVYAQGHHFSFQQLHRPTMLLLAKSFLQLQVLAKCVIFMQEASNCSWGNKLLLSWISLEKMPMKRTAAYIAAPRIAPFSTWRMNRYPGVRLGR